MADKKITELNAITGINIATNDLFLLVDLSASQNVSITYEELSDIILTKMISANFVGLFGQANTSTGGITNAFALGLNNKLTENSSVVVGLFAADKANAAFRVGVGTSFSDRLNAISVDKTSGTTTLSQIAIPRAGVPVGIVSDTVTFLLSGGYQQVIPESGLTDNLHTINTVVAPTDGQRLTLTPQQTNHTITIVSGTGNIFLPSGTSVALNGSFGETITLMWHLQRSRWVRV